jgi:hypothetical protein
VFFKTHRKYPVTTLEQLPKGATPSLSGPAFEYVQILRSFLSDSQKALVRQQVEANIRMGRHVSVLGYAEFLQAQLTSWQRASALERLELAYRQHGWRAGREHAHAA